MSFSLSNSIRYFFASLIFMSLFLFMNFLFLPHSVSVFAPKSIPLFLSTPHIYLAPNTLHFFDPSHLYMHPIPSQTLWTPNVPKGRGLPVALSTKRTSASSMRSLLVGKALGIKSLKCRT